MSRPVSYGYKVPGTGRVSASAWLVTPAGHEPLSSPDAVANWHYATDLFVERPIQVNLEELREDVGLGPEDSVLGIITWSATASGLQGSSDATPLSSGVNTLQASIPGAEAGGVLRLKTVIVAALHAAPTDPLAPQRNGSVLWSDAIDVVLEGDATRFPTEVLSFSATGAARPGTAWCIEVRTTDLDAPAMSSVRVLLNTDHAMYQRLTAAADSGEAQVSREFLSYDVARQLVQAALAQEDFVASTYDPGSIGAVLRARLRDYFGSEGDEVEPLRKRWLASPGDIDHELQAFFSL